MNKIITNPNFWDCECKEDYIHHISETNCKICGAIVEDQPDSRQDEIEKFFPEMFEGKEKVPEGRSLFCTGAFLTVKNGNLEFEGMESVDSEMYLDGKLVEYDHWFNAYVVDKD